MAGSTRQQTVGRIIQVGDRDDGDEDEDEDKDEDARINQVADRGDGDEDEDKDEDEDEIPYYAVLLTALVERVGVSRKRDFLQSILRFSL